MQRHRSFKFLIVGLALALLVGLVSCGSPSSSGGSVPDQNDDTEDVIWSSTPVEDEPIPDLTYQPPERTISVSDQSVLFTAAAQTAFVDVAVIGADDAIVDGATVTVAVSPSNVVDVAVSGSTLTLTSETAVPSSAIITVTSDDAQETAINVAVAKLNGDAFYVPEEDIQSFEDGVLTIVTSPSNDYFTLTQLGDSGSYGYVIGNDGSGLFGEVVEVIASATNYEFRVSTTEVTLGDVFEEVSIVAEGAEVRGVARLNEDGLNVYWPDLDGTLQPSARLGFECTADGQNVDLDFSGSNFDYDVSVRPTLKLEMSGATVDEFELSFAGRVSIEARSGTITLNPSAGRTITCERASGTIGVPVASVFGFLNLAPTIKPVFGIAIEASSQANELSITGPQLDRGFVAKAGVTYTPADGMNTVSEFREIGEGVSWGAYNGDLDVGFSAKVEPYFKIVIAATGRVFRTDLVSFEFADAKVGASADLSLSAPFDPLVRNYTGPQWAFNGTGALTLNPLKENVSSLNSFLELLSLLGIDASLDDINAELASGEVAFGSSPSPKTEASKSWLPADMSLVAVDAGDGGNVSFLGFNGAAASERGVEVARATPEGGNAHTRWLKADQGATTVREVRARVYEAPFGNLGLPYAKDQGWLFEYEVPGRAFVEVPAKDDVTRGDESPNWVSVPADEVTGTPVVKWSDGNANREVSMDFNQNAGGDPYYSAEISTTFDTDGLQYQYVRIEKDDGSLYDDRSIPVLVGDIFADRVRYQDPPSLEAGVPCQLGPPMHLREEPNSTGGYFATVTATAERGITINGDCPLTDGDFVVVAGRSYTFGYSGNSDIDLKVRTSRIFKSDAVTLLSVEASQAGLIRPRFTVPWWASELYYMSDDDPEHWGTLYVIREGSQ